MFLDRIFALLAAIATVLALIHHTMWVILSPPMEAMLELTTASLVLPVISLVYLTIYAGRRDGIEYDAIGEASLQSFLKRIPVWLSVTTNIGIIYGIALTAIGIAALVIDGQILNAACAARASIAFQIAPGVPCSPFDYTLTGMVVIFGAVSFASTAYLLGLRR